MKPLRTPEAGAWRVAFGGILVVAMVAATQMASGLGILAPFIRDDLGISRTKVGVLIYGDAGSWGRSVDLVGDHR